MLLRSPQRSLVSGMVQSRNPRQCHLASLLLLSLHFFLTWVYFLCCFPSYSAYGLVQVVVKIAAGFHRFISPRIPNSSKKCYFSGWPFLGYMYIWGAITVFRKMEYYSLSRPGSLGHCCDHGPGAHHQQQNHASTAISDSSQPLRGSRDRHLGL